MTNELTTPKPASVPAVSPETAAFDLMARRAKALSESSLVPKQYQGKPANCLMVLEIAERLRMPVMLVFQQMHEIHGRPSWSAQFLIAAWNSSGDVGPIRYNEVGTKGGDDYGVFASSTDLNTGEILEGPVVTMAMAKAEGWSTKAGSKWKTMPDLMLRYRAAAFLVRTVKPELTMGLLTADEVRDISKAEQPKQAGEVTHAGESAETQKQFSELVGGPDYE
jgi:hypothetical protein